MTLIEHTWNNNVHICSVSQFRYYNFMRKGCCKEDDSPCNCSFIKGWKKKLSQKRVLIFLTLPANFQNKFYFLPILSMAFPSVQKCP